MVGIISSPPADWPDRMHVTGYWFLDPPPGWQSPADLLHFLRAGPAPVSIGFGSMASRDAEATLNLVLLASCSEEMIRYPIPM
jgi:sterol 3beta-glucosyltransferase